MASASTASDRTLLLVAGRIFKNYTILAFCYAVSRLVTFLAIVYLARRLDVSGFGQVNFAMALVLYFTLLTHLGLMTVGTRQVAREPGQIKRHAENILALRLMLAAVSFILLVVFTLLVPLRPRLGTLIVLFGLSLFSGAAILDWAFKGVQRMGVVGAIEIIRAAPYLVLIFLWVQSAADITRIPVFYLVSMAAAALFSLVMFARAYGRLHLSFDLRFWKSSLLQSLPLGVAFIMVQVYYLMDTVLLGFLKGDVSVGMYSPAYRVVAFVQGIGGMYFETVFPMIARSYTHSSEKLLTLMKTSVQLSALVIVPVAVLLTVLGNPIIQFLYGPKYAASALAFKILIWAIAIELLGMNFGYALMACDRVKEYLEAVTLGAVTSLVLNVLLIPGRDIAGAATARLASEVVVAVWFFHRFTKVAHVPIGGHFLKPLLAGILMASGMLLTSFHWVVEALLGVLIYGTVISLLARNERTLLVASLRQAFARTAGAPEENPNAVQARACEAHTGPADLLSSP
jgi:O-antigen/teichoic acid export membrane protein